MEFADFYKSLYGFPPFPWQGRLAKQLASGSPPQAIAAPTASGKTGVIDAWVWALAFHPDRVNRRLWYVVQRRILVDDTYARAKQIVQRLPGPAKAALMALSAAQEPLNVLRLRGGVFEDMATIDPSTPIVICSTADQHMSRLLFRGYGVSDNSLPLHAALAGTRTTVVIDEAHILPTYEENLRRCVSLGAELRIISMTATPDAAPDNTLRLDESDHANEVLARRLSCTKPAKLIQGEKGNLSKQAKGMLKDGCRAIVVFCNTAETAAAVAASIPKAWLLTGRIREYDRRRMFETLEPLRAGGPGPESPTVVVATQTLEVGADLDFDGLVTECASLSALRQRFGRLNRLGLRERTQAAIVWDGKKQAPVYGSAPANVFAWLRALGDAPDMSATSIDDALRVRPPAEALDVRPEHGPPVTRELLETWKQTNPRPLWDVPVANYIDPSDDITVTLVWRDEPPNPMLVEAYPPHHQEAAPVPLSAVQRWAGDRIGVRWRGPKTATTCAAAALRPGDVWIIQAGEDDGRLDLGCVLADSPADVADVPGERIRARGELLEAIEDGESLERIARQSGITEPVITPRGEGYVVVQRKRGQSLSTGRSPLGLEEHCQAVANQAGLMAERLGLDRQLLQAAGALHDIGKADPRMQAWLGAAPGERLAKSGHSASAMRNLRPDDLPHGWRHELLSVRMLPSDTCPVLAHLVASHHGRCRPSLPEHANDGQAAIDFGGLRLQSGATGTLELDAEAISRFAAIAMNPWEGALLESVLVMADRIASRDELTAGLVPIVLPKARDNSPVLELFRADALDGRTLLGWMAAVGALCVLSEERPTRLHWDALDRGVFVGWALEDATGYLAERLKLAPPVCRPEVVEEFDQMVEWGPAVGRWEGGVFKQSPLLATGAALTGFARAWPKLAAAVNGEKVREAILGPWKYYEKLGQRWDPLEHAEHGSQWGDPSREGANSVHGANRLAIEALRLMPTIATGYTIGWNSEQQAITWPLWRAPLTIEGVRIAIRQPMRERWMSRKISVGQLASFLPAEPCERLGAGEIPITARKL